MMRVEYLCRHILTRPEPPIIGIASEGIERGKPIALFQVSFEDHSYIFDLLSVNPFDDQINYNLRQVLTSNDVLKIVHDFTDTASALIN